VAIAAGVLGVPVSAPSGRLVADDEHRVGAELGVRVEGVDMAERGTAAGAGDDVDDPLEQVGDQRHPPVGPIWDP
jgi:hypothetical protein